MLSMNASTLPFGGKTLCSALLLAASLSACNDDDKEVVDTNGALQIVNTMIDSPYLEVTVSHNGETIRRYNDMRYGHATPGLLLAEGNYDITLTYFDITTGEKTTLVQEQDYTITEDEFRTLVLTGPFAQADTTDTDKPLEVFIDDFADDTVELQALNDTDLDLDIYVSAPDATLSDANKWVNVDADTFSTNSLQDHIDDNDYRIRITEEGSATVLFDSGTMTIREKVRGLFTITQGRDNTLDVVYSNLNGGVVVANETVASSITTLNLYPLHTATNHTLEDPADNSVLANYSVDFGDTAAAITTSASFVDVTVNDPSNLHDDAENTFTLEADHIYTHVAALEQAATATDADDMVSKLIETPILAQANAASVQFINGLGRSDQNSDPRVDMYVLEVGEGLATASPTASDVTFLGSASFNLLEDSYDIVVTERNSQTVLAGPTRITVEANHLVLIGLSEGLNGGTPNQLSVQEVDL